MATLPTASRRKKRKKRRRRHDEREEASGGASANTAGLSLLQQSIGNRAVQRMLDDEAAKAGPQKSDKAQRQEEEANGSSATVEVMAETEEAPEEFSNVELLEEYPISDKLEDLESDFRGNVEALIDVLEEAGARVEILATAWPPERAYLMHFAWLIANDEIDPRAVPPLEEIDFDEDPETDLNISWWHGSLEASQYVAEEILKECGLDDLDEAPNLFSHHVTGEAIDMKITWGGKELIAEDPLGGPFIIAGGPHDETHEGLIELAATFGVIHYNRPDENPVHWSVDGE